MKLIACLSVYNEMQFIERVIDGLLRFGVEKAVAVDGAYQGFPHESWASDDGTLEYLASFQKHGWLKLVKAPPDGWPGQEIKRTAYLRAADKIAREGDWLIQVDGDEELAADEVGYNGLQFRDTLASLDDSIALVYVAMRNAYEEGPRGQWGPFPKVYRWEPGLYYGREHWDILRPSGKAIWDLGMSPGHPHTFVWPYFRFHHWGDMRRDERKNAKSEYENYRADFRRQFGAMNPAPSPSVEV